MASRAAMFTHLLHVRSGGEFVCFQFPSRVYVCRPRTPPVTTPANIYVNEGTAGIAALFALYSRSFIIRGWELTEESEIETRQRWSPEMLLVFGFGLIEKRAKASKACIGPGAAYARHLSTESRHQSFAEK
ncbi:hypothetical protein Zmor_009701 [Zophobas morio]|uniref:Uncharacterized protein n=1 Tax=Zophobas morio TaxID=2755281 RepID=A0AA38ILT4_9CUCU|nr:hypothetical protein Zmor_009701 [Zophobas morio]